MREIILFCCIQLICFSEVAAQSDNLEEAIIQTFRHTRIINSQSVETLPARKLDFRVVHRFGDLAGINGGWPTFYGLENASDISIGFEYGLSNRVTMGIMRAKGAGPLKQNISGLLKAKIMGQERNGNIPFTLTAVGIMSLSTMQKSELEGTLNFFEKQTHRMTSHFGLHLARKFSDRFSAQFNAQWTYRNLVLTGDENDLVSIGGGIRAQLGKSIAILLDSTFPILSELRNSDNDYYPSLGVGLEFDTQGGHVFQLNLTNSRGIVETDYIPYTRSNWGDGEFRLGFTISRLFNM